MNPHASTLTIGSFASGQAADLVARPIVGSFAHGQAADPALDAREGAFATGQAQTDPAGWAIGRFSTGQEHMNERTTRLAISIDTRRTAEASAAAD